MHHMRYLGTLNGPECLKDLCFLCVCVFVCRWWFVFQQAIDTVLQSVRMENSTPGERVILAD